MTKQSQFKKELWSQIQLKERSIIELDVIYNCDCLEGMAELPTASIDMILCDLPYGTTANTWDKIIPFASLWGQYERLIKPQGAIVLTANERFSADVVQSNPALYRYKWVWVKNTVTNFVNAKNRPLSRFEEILVFSKSGTANYGNSPDTIGMNYFPQGLMPYNKTVTSRKYEQSNQLHPWNAPDTYTQEWTNYPSDVLNYKSDRTGWHPTQKPVELFAYLIKTYSQPNDLVLDNCMGSGTTAIAAIDTDRTSSATKSVTNTGNVPTTALPITTTRKPHYFNERRKLT